MNKDHNKIKKYISIAKGQLDGIIKMIEDDRYCLDIYDQISATRALLKKANNLILSNHIEGCVKDALIKGDNEKVDELIKVLEKQI